MEALMRADNGLTQDQIHWAIKNIPNDDQATPVNSNDTTLEFDHSKDSILDACGITSDETKSLFEELKEINNATKGNRKSHLIEDVFKYGSQKLKDYLLIRGIISVIDASQEYKSDSSITDRLDELMKFLKDKGKKK